MDHFTPFKNGSHNLSQDPEAVNRSVKEGRSGIVRAAGLMGGLTLVSRVLGMVRDIVCARAFGTTWQWDAFVYAFMLPNFFRRLVGEGALSSAFIPVYSGVLSREGKVKAFRFANVVLTVLAAVFLVFLLVYPPGMADVSSGPL